MALAAGLAFASAATAVEVVVFTAEIAPGTIVIKTSLRKLYLVLGEGKALRYPVGVGRAGRQWVGSSFIEAKFLRPNWAPPAEIRRDRPELPAVVPSGSPANPMGAAAMTLSGGNYAIHGTNAPDSIGGFVSYGCIRMYNADITDLFARVKPGTPVVVMR
ncbi:MAG: L,D-transpeptidase [Devosia sp.]|uniref:L,D-transpeptidase n=1 Tax=Devosia sp. TaxID=1871048 RepID=UPI00262BA3DB|nr:L,D-transpeptidase [Devosia sp.]MDB5541270.1 L,D-transpeptidase [Devosia sp.]